MTRIYNFFALSVCCLAAYFLFFIKDSVRILSEQNAEFNRKIAIEKQKLHNLRAEIAFLTSPARLGVIIDSLNLAEVHRDQAISNPILGNISRELVSTNGLQNKEYVASNIKWRYKKHRRSYTQINSKRSKSYTQTEQYRNINTERLLTGNRSR
jgi:hypothetical protein